IPSHPRRFAALLTPLNRVESVKHALPRTFGAILRDYPIGTWGGLDQLSLTRLPNALQALCLPPSFNNQSSRLVVGLLNDFICDPNRCNHVGPIT
ncbi:unnamed protein product, partial [Ectocarpus sp. 12 AP-2014]